MPHRVTVVVTPGCHLCEDAVARVGEVCDPLGIVWESVELSTLDEKRQAEWREMVPVTLVDGAVHDIFRVNPDRLRSAVAG
ncbi:MAG TPA: glutaredoxin family protein [Mycobacteriales bacterium]|nr:glutaredoxin family protein [Mycobacteriales bacterium]